MNNCKKIIAILALLQGINLHIFCHELPIITISPTATTERIARIAIQETLKKPTISFAIITRNDGIPIRALEIKQKDEECVVEWDGIDNDYKVAPAGKYYVILCTNLYWQLDNTFGLNGRIGSFEIKQAIEDPTDKITLPEGLVYSINLNGTNYPISHDDTIGGNYCYIKDNKFAFSSSIKISKGDELTIKYYFPTFFENPWQIEVASNQSLYVLLWPTNQGGSSIVKLSPDGKSIDTNFAASGTIKLERSHQFALDEEQNLIFAAGATRTRYGIGVYSLKTGAPLYTIASKDPRIRHFGLCLTSTNIIHSFDGYSFDRTCPDPNPALLYYDKQGNLWYKLPPLIDTYWGPSMTALPEEDIFFVSDYQCTITKCKALPDQNVSLYSIHFSDLVPLGLAFDKTNFLLFAALRNQPVDAVAILLDTGKALKKLSFLSDKKLGPAHSVCFSKNYLYVVEDCLVPLGRSASKTRDLTGKNRISRYRIFIEKTAPIATIEIK